MLHLTKRVSGELLLRAHCEIAATEVVPVIRAAVVYYLRERYKLSNYTIAKKIGTTASSVTNYLKERRGKSQKVIELLQDPELEKMIKMIAKKIAEDDAEPEELSSMLCATCRLVMKKWKKQECVPLPSLW
jgi:predicted transcriptional regulator